MTRRLNQLALLIVTILTTLPGLFAQASPTGLATATAGAQSNAPLILVFGDSLSAEYGLKRGSGWVALMQDQLKKEGFPHRIMNASISGETTAGGQSRLPATLKKYKPNIMILELGANDGLRGLPVAQTERNLRSMISLADSAGAKSLIVGIRVPPNYGSLYAKQFDGIFSSIAQSVNAPLVPFMLAGIADNPKMFQSDGIHPNEQAQRAIFANIWPTLVSSELLGQQKRP